MGFSQGGALVGILSFLFQFDLSSNQLSFPNLQAMKSKYQSNDNQLSFLPIIAGGYLASDFLAHLFNPNTGDNFKMPLISGKSVHIIGENDTVVLPERSKALLKVFDPTQSVELMHPGAHFIPYSQSFLKKLLENLPSFC